MVTVAALVVALIAAASTLTATRALRNQQRAHERERSRLIDQVCHLAGKPWALPPREIATPLEPAVADDADADLIDV